MFISLQSKTKTIMQMNKYILHNKECYSTGLIKDSTISGLVEVEYRNEDEIGWYSKKYFTKNAIKI